MSLENYVAHVEILLKTGVLDPQGKAVAHGLQNLGFDSVKDVRIGKLIEVRLQAPSKEKAQELAEQMSQKLLANPVIEKFKIQIEKDKV